MDAKASLRDQLQTLRIPKEQRPSGIGEPTRRSSRSPGILASLLLLALGAAGYAAWQWLSATGRPPGQDAHAAAPPATAPAQTSPAGEAPAGAVLTATGKIVSDHQVQVVTKVSGQIVALFFEQGDPVAEGQLLARIEDVNYRARRDEAAALVERARAALEFYRANHGRVSTLFQDGQVPEIEYRDARRWLDEGEAQLAAARAALTYAEKQLQDTEVVAPIAGVVLERNVEVGDFVAAEGGRGANANAQFATIADMSKLRVEVDISELDVSRIRRGMRCRVTPDAYKNVRYDGYVLWIDPGANYAKATVQAKVRVVNPDEHLRIEGTAQVQFLAD
jgi:HlyD family secretion protein